ncbi:MAG TPA: phage tail sheath C-terminal domain-containing protein [Flavobacterium sp.]|jgi:hypothetical protein
MAPNYQTPGVYIVEKNAFPGSAAAVETAIPVFIGYTEKSERDGKSLLYKPTRVTSYADFLECFGKGFPSQFTIEPSSIAGEGSIMINGKAMVVRIRDNNTAVLYNAIRLFYSNGGSVCYVLSVKTYGRSTLPQAIEVQSADSVKQVVSLIIDIDDFIGADNNVFSILETESEPTLVVLPDVVADPVIAYQLYPLVLQHCAKMQNRFAIFDVIHKPGATIGEECSYFKEHIGVQYLDYGAAYYPFLKTSIVQQDEIGYNNLDASVNLRDLLREDNVSEILSDFEALQDDELNELARVNLDHSLKAASPVFNSIVQLIRSKLNLLPPSPAIAGVYTLVDTSRRVWTAPANISLSMVTGPAVDISHEVQQNLNVDVISGKSINVIRSFPNLGTLVWGARTLDGNSSEWKYVNVRRTMIMIEQSLKYAVQAYVFEANNANTWVTVSSMLNNFLYNLWTQGALAGSTPDQAFHVRIGLGTTMTPHDVLDGIMRISVMVAILRPAEFTIITFQQQMQQS